MIRFLVSILVFALPGVAASITIDPPGSANAWDFYVLPGTAPQMIAILESLKAVVTMPGFQSLMVTIATAGVVFVGFTTFKNRPEKIVSYVIVAWLVTYASFDLKTDIVVTDSANISTGLVTGVPAAIGMPAAVMSGVGTWLTEAVEQNFSIPSELKMSQGSVINLNQKMIDALHEVKLESPTLRASLSNYVAECVIPWFKGGHISPDDVYTSTNLWETMKVTNRVMMTEIYSSTGSSRILTCDETYTALTSEIQAHMPRLLKQARSGLAEFYDTTGVGQAFVDSAFQAGLQQIAITGTPGQTAVQAGVIDAFRKGLYQAGSQWDVNGLIQSVNLEQAKATQAEGWRSAATLYGEQAPLYITFIKLFAFGSSFAVLAGLLIPGVGPKVFSGWLFMIFGVILLEPSFALVNYISVVQSGDLYPMAMNADGINLENQMSVTSTGAALKSKMGSYAALMTTMVATMLLGIMKGSSVAFTSMQERAAGSSAANAAATNTAQGSINAGNSKYNTTSANSHDLTHSRKYGYVPDEIHQSASGSTLTYNHQGGQMTTIDGVNQTRQTSVQNTAAIQSAISQRRGEHDKISDSTSLAAQSAFAEAKERATASLLNEQGGEQRSRSKEEVDQIAATQAFEAVYTASRRAGMSHDQSMNAAVVGALGTGKGSGGSLKGKEDSWWKSMVGRVKGGLLDLAGISARMEAKFTDKDAVTHNQENNAATNNKDGSSKTQSVSDKHGEGHSWQRTGGHSESGSDATRFLSTDTSTHLRAAAQEWTESQEKLDSLNQQLVAAESQTVTRGLRPDEIQQTLQQAGAIQGQVQSGIINGGSELAGNRKEANQVNADIGQGTVDINASGYQVAQTVKDNHDAAEKREVNGLIQGSQHVADEGKLQNGMVQDAARNNDRSYQQYAELLKKQEEMDRDKEVAYAAFGAVYGFDKGGVIGAVAGTAISGGAVFLDHRFGGGSDGEQELRGSQMDVAGLDLRDIEIGNGKTAQAAGFVLSDGGQAHAMYFVAGEGYGFMNNDGNLVFVNGDGGPQVSGGPINSLTPAHLNLHPEKG